MFGTVEFVSKRCIQKYRPIGLYFFVFEFSPFIYTRSDTFIAYNCLKISFLIREIIYIRIGRVTPEKGNASKTGNDVIIFSTLLNPAMFGTIGFVSKRRFQIYVGNLD